MCLSPLIPSTRSIPLCLATIAGTVTALSFPYGPSTEPAGWFFGKPVDDQKHIEQLLEGDDALGFYPGGAQDSSQGKQEVTQHRCIILQ